jgi:hypothetical protein
VVVDVGPGGDFRKMQESRAAQLERANG